MESIHNIFLDFKSYVQDYVFPYFQCSCSLEEKEPIKIAEQVTVNDRGAVK